MSVVLLLLSAYCLLFHFVMLSAQAVHKDRRRVGMFSPFQRWLCPPHLNIAGTVGTALVREVPYIPYFLL